MAGRAFEAAVAHLRAAVDELLVADVSGLERETLTAAFSAVEVQRRRLEVVDQRLLARAGESSLASAFGQPGLADVLAMLLRVDPREARARVRRATDLGPRHTLTGEPLPPILPAVAEAVAAGLVSGAQADVILDAIEHLPSAAPVEAGPVVERVLVEAARHEAPRALRRTAAELLARLDPDGLEPVEDKAARRRGFTLTPLADGTSRASGRFSAELTAYLEAVLDALAAPQPVDDHPDPRTAPQRRHDALLEAATRILRSGTLPAAGGVPVTVLATTTITELTTAAAEAVAAAAAKTAGGDPTPTPTPPPAPAAALTLGAEVDLPGLLALDGAGLALLGHGQLLSARQLLTLACAAQVIPVVFNDAGGILTYGRTRRLASREQRLALVARDGGCCFPGCDRPAAWTEVHHVIPWAAGGTTDLDNLVLVCAFHHRHFEQAGWQVTIDDGVPLWTPPAWLDPHRRPRRNTTHHRPEITFRQPTAA